MLLTLPPFQLLVMPPTRIVRTGIAEEPGQSPLIVSVLRWVCAVSAQREVRFLRVETRLLYRGHPRDTSADSAGHDPLRLSGLVREG